MNDVDHAIGAESEMVSSMTNAAFSFEKELFFVKNIITVRVAKPVESFGIVRIYVKGIISPEQAARFFEVIVDDFGFNHLVAVFS